MRRTICVKFTVTGDGKNLTSVDESTLQDRYGPDVPVLVAAYFFVGLVVFAGVGAQCH
jgi:hypothetical protein